MTLTLTELAAEINTKARQSSRCVVRLTTSYWSNNRGIHCKKDLQYLRRASYGFNVIEEDTSCGGAEEVVTRITNLHECDDGVYEVVICNEHRDWETGSIEEYDYKLLRLTHEEVDQYRKERYAHEDHENLL